MRKENAGGGRELEGRRGTNRITSLNTMIQRERSGWNCSSTLFSTEFMVLIQIFYMIKIDPVPPFLLLPLLL